jgi:hypothetical protein
LAKRITTEEAAVRARITETLNDLGRKVIAVSSRNSKISKKQKDHLRDSGNYRVKPYNVLVLTQYAYGKYNTPKGKPTPTDRSNITDTPLNNAIEEYVDIEVNILVKDLIKMIVDPIVKK